MGSEKGSGTFPIREFFHPCNHRYAINLTFAHGSKRQGSRNLNKTVRSQIGVLAMFPRRVPWQRKSRIQRLKQLESAEVTHGIITDESGK